MSNHTIIIPFDENLLSKFRNNKIIVRTNAFNEIEKIFNSVEYKNNLHAIWIEIDDILSSIAFSKEWAGIPLVIYGNDLGSFRNFIRIIDLFKKLNIQIFFPSNNPNTPTNLKILSSLGIYSGIWFGKEKIEWESIIDLMHYAIYNKAYHIPIEPFHYIASNYQMTRFLDFSSVYFNDPTKFLHVNSNEQIALTCSELTNGNFIADGLESINDIEENESYKNRLTSWQDFFLKEEGCAYCPSWRICLGKFSETSKDNSGCRDLFSDLIDASIFYQSQTKKNKGTKWTQ